MKFIIIELAFFTIAVNAKETHMDFLDILDFLHPSVIQEEQDVKFYLFTRNNRDKGIEFNETNLDQIDEKLPVKIIVHGWLTSIDHEWVKAVIDEYLYKDDCNVIQVDWTDSAFLSYDISAYSTIIVGATTGNLIVNLHKNYAVPLTNFHLIGHSLGAQISGYAGKTVFNLTGSRLSRISALDAASPLFEDQVLLSYQRLQQLFTTSASKKEPLITNEMVKQLTTSSAFKSLTSIMYDSIQETDADIVDAIHTDACEFGYTKPFGTIDFYPNGGTPIQPGCLACPSTPTLFDVLHFSKIKDCLACSHYRSCWYFINSINNGNFVGTKCSSWNKYKSGSCNNNFKAVMGDGYTYSPEATGKFYLRTNSKAPFAQNA